MLKQMLNNRPHMHMHNMYLQITQYQVWNIKS